MIIVCFCAQQQGSRQVPGQKRKIEDGSRLLPAWRDPWQPVRHPESSGE